MEFSRYKAINVAIISRGCVPFDGVTITRYFLLSTKEKMNFKKWLNPSIFKGFKHFTKCPKTII